MLHPAEAEFIRCCICKNKRDRLLLELSDEKRRARAINRFAHTAEDFLMMNKLVISGSKLSKAQILSALKEGSKSDLCHVIMVDGSTMETSAALAVEAVYGEETAIVIAENAVYVETEPYIKAMRYVLSLKNE